MKLRSLACTATLGLALAFPAVAADNHPSETGAHAGHDDKARHGGVVRVVKDVNYELVVKKDSVELYVADHGKPVDLKGASAKLTLLSTTAKSEVELAPLADRLEAKGNFEAAAGTKALANVSLAGKAPQAVNFVLK